MEIVCRQCGQPVVLEDIPVTVDDQFRPILQKLAEGVLHDRCAEERRQYRRGLEEAAFTERRLATLGGVVPPLYQGTEAARLATKACVRALGWAWGARGLVLYGLSGCGKSRCAYELCRREHMTGRAVVTMTHGDWFVATMRLRMGGRGNALRWLEIVRTCDLFLLDDLGKARMDTSSGDFTEATALMFDALDARNRAQLPNIITTQFVGSDLESRLGDNGTALVRRMRENGETVHFTEKLQ